MRMDNNEIKKDRFRIGKTFITITTPQDAKKRIADAVRKGQNAYVCASDPRTVDYACVHEDYCELMNNSLMNTPDGQPTMWAAKLWGVKGIERTMGPILFQDMITDRESGLKHFLLGDTEETLKAIVEKASVNKENIVGTYSPPFCSLDEFDYEGMAKMINESHADVVWTALRAPKQDFFNVRLLPYLDKKVCVGVGAAFRFYLGEYKLAPPLIRKLGLMGIYWGTKGKGWPKFLKDYAVNNLPFLWYLAKIPFWRMMGRNYYE